MATAPTLSEVSRHKCLIYDGDPAEQLPVVLPLLMDGLRENDRCLYLGSPATVEMVDSALGARGVDLDAERKRGALVFSSDRSHLEGGRFEPRAMVEMLRSLIDDAVRDGFRGLCATGDMMWELGTEENFDRLMEYEALLEQVFREKPLRGICQYHRRVVPVSALRDALVTHRSAYIGSELHTDNLFYVPPDILLEGLDRSISDKHGVWMYQQITRIMAAERKRDQALDALRESEAEQRRLAEELARANQDLERRVQDRTDELQALNKELEGFSYSVSHDLRAPLRGVQGFADILLQDHAAGLSAEGKDLLAMVIESGRRMDQLILDLLRFAHLSRQSLNRQPVDIANLVEEVLRELRSETAGRTMDLRVGDLPTAIADRALLKQVFTNLLSNAFKFTRRCDHAVIDVGSRLDEGRTVYFVRDNGAGFDMRYADKLFGVFQRMHTREQFEGTGVGLSLAHRIVARHGGRLWADSAVDAGATFSFTLSEAN